MQPGCAPVDGVAARWRHPPPLPASAPPPSTPPPHPPAKAVQGHHEEVRDQHRGAGVEARQQGDGARRVHAPQRQVVKARLTHLLVRARVAGAKHLRTAGGWGGVGSDTGGQGQRRGECAAHNEGVGRRRAGGAETRVQGSTKQVGAAHEQHCTSRASGKPAMQSAPAGALQPQRPRRLLVETTRHVTSRSLLARLVQRIRQGVDGRAEGLAAHVKGGGGVCGGNSGGRRNERSEGAAGAERRGAPLRSPAPACTRQKEAHRQQSTVAQVGRAGADAAPQEPAAAEPHPTWRPCWTGWAAGAACRTAGWCR